MIILSSLSNGNDFDAFCELVSLSSDPQSWCSNCASPCSDNSCGVTCDSDNTRITGISAGWKGLTSIPDSIDSLASLQWL